MKQIKDLSILDKFFFIFLKHYPIVSCYIYGKHLTFKSKKNMEKVSVISHKVILKYNVDEVLSFLSKVINDLYGDNIYDSVLELLTVKNALLFPKAYDKKEIEETIGRNSFLFIGDIDNYCDEHSLIYKDLVLEIEIHNGNELLYLIEDDLIDF